MVKKKISLDDIDICILEVLRKNPRESLRNISKYLSKRLFKATPETIRKRIQKLSNCIEFQAIPKLDVLGYDQAVLLIKVKGGENSRKKVINKIESKGFNICETIGSFDILYYIVLKKNSDLREIVDMIRSLPEVSDVNYLMMAKHHSTISSLLRRLRE